MKKYLAVIFCAVLISCGGGGGGGSSSSSGGTSSVLTSSNTNSTGDAVLKSLNMAGTTSDVGGSTQKAIGDSTRVSSPLRDVLSAAYAHIQTQNAPQLMKASENCSGGGSLTVSGSNLTYSQCKSGTTTFDGTLTVSTSGNKIIVTTPSFSYSETSGDTNLVMTNISMTYNSITFSGSLITGFDVTLTGTITGKLEGESGTHQYSGFGIIYSSNSQGVTLSVSGSTKFSCLGDWVTLSTTTPAFFPSGSSCPTAGDISVSSGGNTTRLTVASDKKITIYFNGTQSISVADCSSLKGVCS